jgi:hypothetical protein
MQPQRLFRATPDMCSRCRACSLKPLECASSVFHSLRAWNTGSWAHDGTGQMQPHHRMPPKMSVQIHNTPAPRSKNTDQSRCEYGKIVVFATNARHKAGGVQDKSACQTVHIRTQQTPDQITMMTITIQAVRRHALVAFHARIPFSAIAPPAHVAFAWDGHSHHKDASPSCPLSIPISLPPRSGLHPDDPSSAWHRRIFCVCVCVC